MVDGVQGPSPKWGLLANFQNLEHLSLANTRVGSLDGFPSFKKLTKLVLSDNHITGGLKALQGLDALQYLDLSNNPIQEIEVLKPLATLKLVSLDLYECPVTRVVDYRTRVFRMITSLKYLDKTDLELKEMPESDEEEDDDEDEEEDPGSGEVDGEREYACNGHVDGFERVGEEDDEEEFHGFRDEIDEEDGEDDGVEDELDDSEDEDEVGDGDDDDNGEDEEDELEEVDNVNVEGGVMEPKTAKLGLEGGEIDGHERGEDDEEDGDGEFDDDEEEDEEDTHAGYLVQPVGHEEIHEGEEEEVDFVGEEEVEDEEEREQQKSATSSSAYGKRKRNTETDGEEEDDYSIVDFAEAAKRP